LVEFEFSEKIICCLIVKKEDELIVSTGVTKLNIISSKLSPKKKKNSQKENRK
jgi:hypothetical protein